jgi:hypothetical protein
MIMVVDSETGEEREETELEKQFQEAFETTEKLFDEQIEIAHKALRKAAAISEAYGVPFRARSSHLNVSYFPESFDEKFPDIDSEFVSDLTATHNEYGDSGWQHSAIC